MTEWRLFPEGKPPFFTEPTFFAEHPWVPPESQIGHAERTVMCVELIRRVVSECGFASWSDLGCGDGSLLAALADLPIPAWGYDAGAANVARARSLGLDVRQTDLHVDKVEYGELTSACEVVEHLADPHGFLAALPGRALVVSSPSAETSDWHYVHHAWAWDLEGYAALVEGAGWRVTEHVECDGELNTHGGVLAPQRFQAIFAMRECS